MIPPRYPLALAMLGSVLLFSLDARFAGLRADDAAECLTGQGDTQIRGCTQIIKTRRLFDKPISKGDLAIAYTNRGGTYSDKGEFDRAIADFDQAIKLSPNLVGAYYNRGKTYHRKGNYHRAIADYTQAVSLNPKFVEAYSNRGNAYEKSGQRDKAVADFRKALELRPEDKVAKRGLKRLGVNVR